MGDTPKTMRYWALDAVAFGVFLICITTLFPLLFDFPQPEFGMVFFAPWLLATVAIFAFPASLSPVRLRLAALSTLGLCPFAFWSAELAVRSVYMNLNAVLAVFAGIWYLLELASEVHAWAKKEMKSYLGRQARFVQITLLYLTLIPVSALSVSFLITFLVMKSTGFSSFSECWETIPKIYRIVVLLPVFGLLRLLWMYRLSIYMDQSGKNDNAQQN